MTAGETESTVQDCPTCGKEVAANAKVCPHCSTILSWSTVDPLVGTVLLDKYQVQDVLGRGGMSAVYKARHMLMDRLVAIKVLRAELVTDPQSLRRFQLESRAVSVLKHPNVMTVHDFGLTPDGIPYLIMDYLEGDTISGILREEGQFQPERCVQLFHQACVGFAHAHSKGVIHRDIKPSNMIVSIDEDGTEVLKIVDFGIAKLLQMEGGSISKLTSTGEVFGSPAYMSPEQCMGTGADARSDIYGLGCVVYESLTGTSPIRGATAMETCMKQINEMPKGFAAVRPDLHLPEEFEATVFKALAKHPEDRFQSMSEFDSALKRALGSGVVLELKSEVVASKTKEPDFKDGDITETIINKDQDKDGDDTKGDTTKVLVSQVKDEVDKKSVSVPPPFVASPAPSDLEDNISAAEQTTKGTDGEAKEATETTSQTEDLPDAGAEPKSAQVDRGGQSKDTALESASTQGDTGSQSPDSATNELSDAPSRIPPMAVPSFDLFGNQLMPAAPDPVNTSQRADTADRSDTGDSAGYIDEPLFGDEDKYLPSILPAAPDPVSSLPASAGQPGQPGSDGKTPQIQNTEAVTNVAAAKKTAGSGANISMVSIVIGSLFVLSIAAFFGFKFVQSQQSTNADKTKETSTTGSGDLSPTEVFKTCTPSIVTLTIMTKAYAVSAEGMQLTDLSGDNPILAGPSGDDKVALFDKGKPAKIVVGKLNTPKGTILVAVKLSDTQPVLIPVNKEGNPLLGQDGKLIQISKGVSLKPYTEEALGSGFYVRPDIVATNCHVVSMGAIGPAGFAGGLAQVTDKPGKFTIMDKPIAVDLDHDLALLYVPGSEAKPLTLLSDYKQLKVGEKVYALGSPKGLQGSISEGIISSDELRTRGENSPKTFLQHTAKIDHGNSGGPLVDSHGQVVGVNTAYAGNGAINLAVVSHFIDDLLDEPTVKEKIEQFAKSGQTDLHG